MLLRSWESGVQWPCSLRPPAPYGETSHGPGAIPPVRRLPFAPPEDEGSGGNAWASPFGKEIALAARKEVAAVQAPNSKRGVGLWFLRLNRTPARTQAFRYAPNHDPARQVRSSHHRPADFGHRPLQLPLRLLPLGRP